MPEETKDLATQEDIKKNKVNAVLSYLGIFIIVPLLSESAKKSKFAKFHMNQGLVFLIAGLVAKFFVFITLLGYAVVIALFVLWLVAIVGAVQGKMKKVPLLGDIVLIK